MKYLQELEEYLNSINEMVQSGELFNISLVNESIFLPGYGKPITRPMSRLKIYEIKNPRGEVVCPQIIITRGPGEFSIDDLAKDALIQTLKWRYKITTLS